MRNFLLEDVLSEDLIGELQFKEINYNDLELELIPASYLDNKSMSNTIIMNEMKKNFSELIFQGIKKKLQDDNIELI